MEVLEVKTIASAKESLSVFFQKHYKQGLESTARFISQKGGTYEDAKDILHDALIILYERIEKNNCSIQDERQYLLGIVKNLWFKKSKKGVGIVSLEEDHEVFDLPTPTPAEQKLLALLEQAGKKCMDLLTAFYFSEKGIHAVRKILGFSSNHSASVQKYKCIEKLKATIKEKSLGYEDFLA